MPLVVKLFKGARKDIVKTTELIQDNSDNSDGDDNSLDNTPMESTLMVTDIDQSLHMVK